MECKICLEKFEKANKLSLHINKHNISKQFYYDTYLRKNNEGICLCGKPCKFINIYRGYHKYCSIKCLSNDSNIKEKIRKKVSGTNHWLKRNKNPKKGKTYEELYGQEKAKLLKNNLSKIFSIKYLGVNNPFYKKTHNEITLEKFKYNRLGKTYEEIFGEDKGKYLRELKRGPKKSEYSDTTYSPSFYSKKLRDMILVEQKNKCAICSTELLKYRKNLHHINYLKKDNRRENLIYLCVSCHTKTNGNRDFWKGYLPEINNMLIKGSCILDNIILENQTKSGGYSNG